MGTGKVEWEREGDIFINPRFATLGVLKIRWTNVGPRFVCQKYTSLSRTYLGSPRFIVPRIKRGCF